MLLAAVAVVPVLAPLAAPLHPLVAFVKPQATELQGEAHGKLLPVMRQLPLRWGAGAHLPQHGEL